MKPLLTDVQWVTFYVDLSAELLSHMGLERFEDNEHGDEHYTEEAQDAFEEIVAIVESHMYDTFRREGDDIDAEMEELNE